MNIWIPTDNRQVTDAYYQVECMKHEAETIRIQIVQAQKELDKLAEWEANINRNFRYLKNNAAVVSMKEYRQLTHARADLYERQIHYKNIVINEGRKAAALEIRIKQVEDSIPSMRTKVLEFPTDGKT